MHLTKIMLEFGQSHPQAALCLCVRRIRGLEFLDLPGDLLRVKGVPTPQSQEVSLDIIGRRMPLRCHWEAWLESIWQKDASLGPRFCAGSKRLQRPAREDMHLRFKLHDLLSYDAAMSECVKKTNAHLCQLLMPCRQTLPSVRMLHRCGAAASENLSAATRSSASP